MARSPAVRSTQGSAMNPALRGGALALLTVGAT
jgi:hypothetical protein